jgi:sigma-B regulation protein RsbU (phosphoserine phosphatase)
MSIRRKLILSLSIPLLLTYAAMLAWDYWRARDQAEQQLQEMVSDRAERLASDFNSRMEATMQSAEVAGAALARLGSSNVTAPMLESAAVTMLRQNRAVPSTIVVVWQPETPAGESAARPEVVTVRRALGGPRVLNLAREGQYVNASFCTEVRRQRKGMWFGPQVDHQLTPANPSAIFCTPILDGERLCGVLFTVLPMEPFRPGPPGAGGGRGRGFGFGGGPEGEPDREPAAAGGPPTIPPPSTSRAFPATRPFFERNTGPQDFMILDNEGRIVQPYDLSKPPPDPILARVEQRPDGKELAAAMHSAIAGQAGIVQAQDIADLIPSHDSLGPHWLALAPIPAAGWAAVAAMPESRVMQPMMQRLWHRAGFLAAGFLILLGVAAVSSIRISRPIERMAKAVDQLASGNLDAQVSGVNSRDELGHLAGAFNSMTRQLKSHVAALTEQTAAREKVESEMRIARQIQTDLLPKTFPPFPDRKEFDLHAVNVPAQRVAGDFYDFFFTSHDLLTIVIADVSGKGMPAALLMAVTRTIVRNLAMEGLSPGQIAERANSMLMHDLSNSMFVTLFLCQYNARTGQLTYVNAGHPRPYRFGANGDLPKQFGEVTGALLGVSSSDVIGPFGERTEQLEVNETLLLYTDGVTEARSPSGAMLRDTGMQRLIVEHQTEGVDGLCNRFIEELQQFQGNRPADDITLVALRRRAMQ